MEKRKLQGKRYINLLRCSSIAQVDTSIEDQRRVLDAFAREHGMVHVDEIALEGVSGSVPGNRTDIEQLIRRKKEQDDFDFLLVHDMSRLTRAGISHAHRIEFDLRAAGIDLLSVMDNIPEGEAGELVKSALSFSNKQQAQSISLASTRGSMSSLLDNRSPYCRRPPYGVDRLYVSPDGQPGHIIRNLDDGTQVKLHPETKQVLATFGRNPRSGIPNHYIKQKQESVVLVPGDEKRVEVLRRMYRRAYLDGWGSYRIAKELNSEGIPSPTGKKWSTTTIGQILLDSVYLGEGIANRSSAAIYNMRGKDRPLPANVEQKDLYTRRRPPRRNRPRSDWHVQPQPALNDLLPAEVREIAMVRQQEHLETQASGRAPKPNRDRHLNSSFFLKGILRSRQGDQPMTGVTTGRKGSKKRYYRVSRAHAAPDDDKVMRRLIPADPLEQAVLETVRATLTSLPDLRDRIETQVRAALEDAGADNRQLDQLLSERDRIKQQLEMVIDRFDAGMQDLVGEKTDALGSQLRNLNDRIDRSKAVVPTDESTIRSIVDETVAAVRDLSRILSESPPESLRRYLRLLIGKLVVDLETRETVLEIRLPTTVDMGKVKMCLVDTSPC